MNRIARTALLGAAALLASACMKDSPVGPRNASVSLHVHFEHAAAGQEIEVSIQSFVPDTEGVVDSLFDGKFPVAAGAQDLTVQFDLSSCLGRFEPDEQGPYCMIEATISLLDNGVVQDQQFTGTMIVRPGQAVSAQPVVLTAGNNVPVITTLDTARIVGPSLIRFTLTGNDPDGDITQLGAIDLAVGVPDIETPYTFFPPLANISGPYYALESNSVNADQVEVFLSDSRFNQTAIQTVPALATIGDVALSAVTMDTTSDSVIATVTPQIDSLELVFLDAVPGGGQHISSICGAAAPPDEFQTRFACARPKPLTASFVAVVPIDFAGHAGNAVICGVVQECVQSPVGERVLQSKRARKVRVRR